MFVRGIAVLLACALAACMPPRVPDEQIVLAAADHVAATNYRVAIQRPLPGAVQLLHFDQIPYANGAELMRENPGCCFLGYAGGDTPRPSCVFPIFEVVTIRYRARYLDETGAQRDKLIERALAVGRNGQVCPED